MEDGTISVLLRWFSTSSTKTCCLPSLNSFSLSTVDSQHRLFSMISISHFTILSSPLFLSWSEPFSNKMFITYVLLSKKQTISNPLWLTSSNHTFYRISKTVIFLNSMKWTNTSIVSSPRSISLGKRTVSSTILTSSYGLLKEYYKLSLSHSSRCIFSVHSLWIAQDTPTIYG